MAVWPLAASNAPSAMKAIVETDPGRGEGLPIAGHSLRGRV